MAALYLLQLPRQVKINHREKRIKMGTQMNPVRGVVSNGAETRRRKYFFNLGGFVPCPQDPYGVAKFICGYQRKSASY